MKKKIFWIIIILAVAIFSFTGYFYFQKWWGAKEQKIQMGLASDKFPWRDYIQKELNKMYPQIKYADVLTRVTPEETYAKFREALRTNNLELALEQLSRESKRYGENVADLNEAYRNNRFIEIYRSYPEKIEKKYMYESIAQYYFIERENDKITDYPMNFLKDANGDWKFDIL